MNRKQALAQIWRTIPRDYRGTTNGIKTVMIWRNGTCLVALEDVTDAEIADRVKSYAPAPDFERDWASDPATVEELNEAEREQGIEQCCTLANLAISLYLAICRAQ